MDLGSFSDPVSGSSSSELKSPTTSESASRLPGTTSSQHSSSVTDARVSSAVNATVIARKRGNLSHLSESDRRSEVSYRSEPSLAISDAARSSRFKVVKLGDKTPYVRGRFTCFDFHDLPVKDLYRADSQTPRIQTPTFTSEGPNGTLTASASFVSSGNVPPEATVPSYTHASGELQFCTVCGDTATGYHYGCMSCEGCKGFFRRSTQKNLQYVCRGSRTCIVDKKSRNRCPQCRYAKCVQQGMTAEMVRHDHPRSGNRRPPTDENREQRQMEIMHSRIVLETVESKLNDQERRLIGGIVEAARQFLNSNCANSGHNSREYIHQIKTEKGGTVHVNQVGTVVQFLDLMAPALSKLTLFAKKLPGFNELSAVDHTILLRASCVEILLFRTSLRYDRANAALVLSNGFNLTSAHWANGKCQELESVLRPVFNLSISLAHLALDEVEVALFMAVLILSERPGLSGMSNMEMHEELLWSCLRKYVGEKYPFEASRFARLMMRALELRTMCSQNAEKILYIQLDGSGGLLEMFVATMFDNCIMQPDH